MTLEDRTPATGNDRGSRTQVTGNVVSLENKAHPRQGQGQPRRSPSAIDETSNMLLDGLWRGYRFAWDLFRRDPTEERWHALVRAFHLWQVGFLAGATGAEFQDVMRMWPKCWRNLASISKRMRNVDSMTGAIRS